jgi:hypothetical protein
VSIPIIIGVTGHRALRKQDFPILRAAVSCELKKLTSAYSNSPFIMLNSIAAGADTLCAEVALELGIRLVCPLPMPIDEYRKDFAGPDATAYDALIQQADYVFVTPDIEMPRRSLTRDDQYRQAGQYVAAHCQVLLALWDGSTAKPDGCGTAETVTFMLNGNNQNGRSCFKAPNDGAVLQILTPQQGTEIEAFTPLIHLLENESGSLRITLATTDAFNADAEMISDFVPHSEALVSDAALADMREGMNHIHAMYQVADDLSLWFQTRYLRAMKCFSAFGALLVLFFLLYDEMESNLFLLSYGLLILVYVLAFLLVRKEKYHEKYLRYRMFSETLRTQFYLLAGGSVENIGNAYTWTQKQESTWIKNAVSAMLIGEFAGQVLSDDAIKVLWIDGQLAYHKSAFRRASAKHQISGRIASWMLVISVTLFVLVLVLEFLFEPRMTQTLFVEPFPPLLMYHSGQMITLRNLMKILLGAVSVMTVFVTNYYGKLSLNRKSIDHDRMSCLYASAKAQYESGQVEHDQLFQELAREEIIEIGNWFSYCRENTPSIQV